MTEATDSVERSSERPRRAHTGRRRNEAARHAVLHAMGELLMDSDSTAITMEALAAVSGVSKQTLYRWWPTKAAVIAEALSEIARERVPAPDTGHTVDDLTAFLAATFDAANNRPVARALRTLLADAQSSPQASDILVAYTSERRAAMGALLRRGQERGELVNDLDIELILDQAFGFIWYRLAVRPSTLDRTTAKKLVERLLAGTAAA